MGGRLLLAGIGVAILVLAGLAVAAARGSGGATAGPGPGGPDGRPSGPNVLVLVTDDARAETLQAMPRTRAWLADGGVTFTQGFATTPSCCPSRASILSGRYVHNHGVLRQRLGDRLDQRTTVASYLAADGYHTAMAGKFLNRWPLRTPPPGFDHWALANGGYYDQPWSVDGTLRRVPTYSTTFIGDRALDWLEEFEGGDAPGSCTWPRSPPTTPACPSPSTPRPASRPWSGSAPAGRRWTTSPATCASAGR